MKYILIAAGFALAFGGPRLPPKRSRNALMLPPGSPNLPSGCRLISAGSR